MIRTVETRIDVLRSGSYFKTLSVVGGATITMEADADIHTSLQAEVLPDEDVNWLSDELRAVMVIDGTEYGCGVFLPATVTKKIEDGVSTVRVEAYDRCWKVQNTSSLLRVKVAKATKYSDAIKTLLANCGITLADIDSTYLTTAEIRDWDVGTDYLSIINELLSEISYDSLWFDGNGYAICHKKSTPTSAEISHTYNADDVTSMMLPQITEKLDIFELPNNFIAVCSNADKSAVLTASAKNENPLSPLSTVRRGRTITKVYKVNNTASQTALQTYVNTLRDESMFGTETIEISTALQPGHGVNDVVGLIHPQVSGVCKETGWRMDFEPGGDMTHTLEKVVYAV